MSPGRLLTLPCVSGPTSDRAAGHSRAHICLSPGGNLHPGNLHALQEAGIPRVQAAEGEGSDLRPLPVQGL